MVNIPPDFPITKCPPGIAMGVYGQHSSPTGKRGAYIPPEEPENELTRLAKAKIGSCLILLGHGKSKVYKNEVLQIELWLESEDFILWCESAGFDPDFIRRRAKVIKENGSYWRAKSGKGKRYEERKAYRKKNGK